MTVIPSAIKNSRKNNIEFEFFHFNKLVISKNAGIEKYLHFKSLECKEYRKGLENLLYADQGGFEHGGLSDLYNTFQNLPRYNSTRLCGWNNLLSNAFDRISSRSSLKDAVIVDFLAGSGTLAKRVRQLLSGEKPNIIGMDVSKKMVECALDSNEAIFWASHEVHPFKSKMADITIAAYGFHHVPLNQRRNFVSAMHRTLKKGGICIIHDFEEGSATARWYSEIIHLYRPEGHPYPHVTKGDLWSLLTPNFQNTTTKYLYDPFYLEGKDGQDSESLKQEFYAYLIGLFNLEKLLPKKVFIKDLANYKSIDYWEKIDSLFSSYFTLTETEIRKVESQSISQTVNGLEQKFNIPIVSNLTVTESSNNNICLIAPRIALIGIGIKNE